MDSKNVPARPLPVQGILGRGLRMVRARLGLLVMESTAWNEAAKMSSLRIYCSFWELPLREEARKVKGLWDYLHTLDMECRTP